VADATLEHGQEKEHEQEDHMGPRNIDLLVASSIRRAAIAAALGAVAATLAFAGGAAAANQDVQCGSVITSNTTLRHDLVDCPGDGIVIGASNITLNLNGHTVDGTAAGQGVQSVGFDDVIVKNGRIKDFVNGVVIQNGSSRNHVLGIGLQDLGAGVIASFADHTLLERNVITNVSDGVRIDYSDATRVEQNSITSVSVHGVVTAGSTTGTTIAGNSISGGQFGIRLAQSGTSGAFVAGNIVGHSSVAGIFVDVSAGNLLIGNTVSLSDLGILVFGGVNTRVEANLTTANTVTGIYDTGGGNSVLLRNVANRNGDDGLFVESSGATVARNTANFNGDLGIEAIAGTIDGGGNHARGNGNPAQCVGVSCTP
jgi:parallel beta-helix repeat protein